MERKTGQKELRKHFVSSLYDTLEGIVSPTPYLEIIEGDRVSVNFLDGKGRLPSPNSTEINILDIDIASVFFDDFHILYEAMTGVGKSYTTDALFDAVYGPEGYYSLRLSGGVLGTSALEPFTTTVLENGVPKTRIDHEKCKRYGALFIDEINRGDSQETLQVVDGRINVNGDSEYLGMPIPGTDRRKGLAIIAAMNPADAAHSSAIELDIAGENRFLKFRFPNGVSEAGSSQLRKVRRGSFHEKFWNEFFRRTGLKGNWREIYPVVADTEGLVGGLNGETNEFIDCSLGYVGYDPKETFARNAEIMRQEGIEPRFAIKDDNDYKKILQAQGTLKHGFVRRDIRKIRDLARLIAFIKGVKKGTYETGASLNDVTAAIGVVLESKTATGSDYGELMVLVNDARAAYSEIKKRMNVPEGFGMRQGIFDAAIYAGAEKGFDAYLKSIDQGISALNTQSTSQSQSTINSRLLADLAVLEHFSRAHEPEVTKALKEKGEGAFKQFSELYHAKKSQSSIYEHRLDSIVEG